MRKRLHVLIVEDNALLREMIAKVLSRAEYRPRTAGSTAAALAQMTLCRPDVAIVQRVAEAAGGKRPAPRLLRALRAQGVPILGLAEGRERDAMLAAGAREVLEMPFEAQALLDALKRVLLSPKVASHGD